MTIYDRSPQTDEILEAEHRAIEGWSVSLTDELGVTVNDPEYWKSIGRRIPTIDEQSISAMKHKGGYWDKLLADPFSELSRLHTTFGTDKFRNTGIRPEDIERVMNAECMTEEGYLEVIKLALRYSAENLQSYQEYDAAGNSRTNRLMLLDLYQGGLPSNAAEIAMTTVDRRSTVLHQSKATTAARDVLAKLIVAPLQGRFSNQIGDIMTDVK